MGLKHARLRAPAGMMIGGTAFAAATFAGQGLKAAITALRAALNDPEVLKLTDHDVNTRS